MERHLRKESLATYASHCYFNILMLTFVYEKASLLWIYLGKARNKIDYYRFSSKLERPVTVYVRSYKVLCKNFVQVGTVQKFLV